MARIEIEMIEEFVFETELAIRIRDINYGNHLGHDVLVSLMHEARVRFLESFGFSEADIDGNGLLVSDLAVIYKSQSFYGDTLKFEIGAGEFNTYGCDLFYRVSNTKTETLVVLAKTGIVFFDHARKKVVKTPRAFSSHFSKSRCGLLV
ncbi:thioesterase family protein [Desulfobacula sp.]|uniref:acyl-CoA thioesterase n=1 Tax=Desulfobacula sp. TaxID=2593537 RepID=UPI0026166BEE|nr:thioesterase family protein [Desulfobacula sp.]